MSQQPCCVHKPRRGKQQIVGSGITISTGQDPENQTSTVDVLIPGKQEVTVSVVYNPINRTINLTLGATGAEPIISQTITMDGLLLKESSETDTSPDIPFLMN